MAEFGQDRVEHDAAERIVFNAEHAQAPRIGLADASSASRARLTLAPLARVSVTASVKVVPPPRRGATTMSPPIARAICLTDDRPSPAPPKRDAIETLACENGRNRRLISSSVRPMPLSEIAKATPTLSFGAAQRRYRQRNAALFGEFHGIVDQVFQRRAQPDGIADHECRKFLGNIDLGLQTFRRRPPGQQISGGARQCSQVEQILPHPGRQRRPRAASTNNVARLARCSAPALMVSTQRRSRSSRSDVASRLLIARIPVSGVRTSCANAASAASTMPGSAFAAMRLRRAFAGGFGARFFDGCFFLASRPLRRERGFAAMVPLDPTERQHGMATAAGVTPSRFYSNPQ